MATPKRTQKQIVEKYKGNLDYYRKGHAFRRLRLFAFLLAVCGSIAAVLTFGRWGKDEYFNTGPISANHQRFAHDCKACHEAAGTDLLATLPVEKLRSGFEHVSQLSPTQLKESASSLNVDAVVSAAAQVAGSVKSLDPTRLRELAEKGLALTELSRMDQACLKCHEPMQLHAPQAASLRLRSLSRELPLVHAGSCSSCHREHAGPERMKLPTSETCASCHNHADELERTLQLIKLDHSAPAAAGENRDLGDGVRRFVIPPAPRAEPYTFASYESGHPPFAYEQAAARDPATLSYNHERHE